VAFRFLKPWEPKNRGNHNIFQKTVGTVGTFFDPKKFSPLRGEKKPLKKFSPLRGDFIYYKELLFTLCGAVRRPGNFFHLLSPHRVIFGCF